MGEGLGGIPQWILDAAQEDVGKLDVKSGERVPLGRLPSALRSALGEITDSDRRSDPADVSLRYDSGISVQIRVYQDRGVIEARIQSDLLRQSVQDETSSLLPRAPIAYREISYLKQRGWALPSELLNQIILIPSTASSQNLTSADCPVWSQEPAHLPEAHFRVSVEVSATFAEGFGIAKEEEIRVRSGV